MLAPGDVLRDYTILAPLRSGGMATLYLASRRGAAGFSRPVAIKVIQPHLAQDPEFVRMFIEEARLSATIIHPHVVHIEELAEEKGMLYLVMEYVHGCSLAELAAALARVGRRFTPELATCIAMQVAAGLHAAHEATSEAGEPLGIVHHDVSPHNVLVARQGYVKLIDFGVAKAQASGRGKTGSVRGKVAYMSPEQAAGRTLDRRTDVYALGIVLWEMLTMRRCFKAKNEFALIDAVRNPRVVPAGALVTDVPPALDDVLMAALQPDPDRRPSSANSLRNMLGEAVPGALKIEASTIADLVALVVEELRIPDTDIANAVTVAVTRHSLTGDEPILQPLSLAAPDIDLQNAVDAARTDALHGGGRSKKALLAAGVVAIVLASGGAAALALSHRSTPVAAAVSAAPPAETDSLVDDPMSTPILPVLPLATETASASASRPPARAAPRRVSPRPAVSIQARSAPSRSVPSSVRLINGVPIVDSN